MIQQHKQKVDQERVKEDSQKEKKKEKFMKAMEKQRQTVVNDGNSVMNSKRKMIETMINRDGHSLKQPMKKLTNRKSTTSLFCGQFRL